MIVLPLGGSGDVIANTVYRDELTSKQAPRYEFSWPLASSGRVGWNQAELSVVFDLRNFPIRELQFVGYPTIRNPATYSSSSVHFPRHWNAHSPS